jgi:hypothetical protein
MTARFLLLMALCSGLIFTSCKKTIENNPEYQVSYGVFKKFKGSSGNSYRYVVATSSWVGISTETTITVRAGKVTGRSYIQRRVTATPGVSVISAQWEETEATLNTHETGAATRTLDAIYEQAKNDWLKKRADATTYFETNNDGMISNCGYVPDGCADDCFVGITITKIERL